MEPFLREATERIGVDDPLLDWPGVSATRKRGPGRSGPGPLALFKCLLAGQCHGLSAPKRGRALKVRLDFMLFCGLDLQGSVPDATLIKSAARPRPHMEAPRDRGEEWAKDDPDLHCSADEDARRVKKGFAPGDEEGFVDKVHVTPAHAAESPRFSTMKRLFGLHRARCPGGAGTHAQRVMAAISLNLPKAANRITSDRQTPASA